MAIPSVNPGDTTDAAISGEGRIADFLAAYLEARGFHVSLPELVPGRPNLLAEYGPRDARQT